MTEAVQQPEQRPASAGEVFGDRVELAEEYATFLNEEGVLRGLIGPKEPARLWSRHLLNSAVAGDAIEPGARVVDIGSGAGFPGIPLAIARPDLTVVLVEPLLRRTVFLGEVVDRLSLTNVDVVRGRAEEPSVIAQAGGADVVTSRAVAPLDRLVRWSAPLMRVGGRLVALKGQSAQEEIDEHAAALARLGIVDLEVAVVGQDLVDPASTLVIGTRVQTEAESRAARRAQRRQNRKS